MTFTPPAELATVLAAFAPLFTRPTWVRAQALLCGTLLAPGAGSVTAALRALGLGDQPRFEAYHRILNRARWSARAASRVLLALLVQAVVPAGATLIIGPDETVERRRGRKITARAIYRDAARSSAECFQKSARARCALDERSPAGHPPLGSPGVGLAVSDRALSLRALRALRALPPRPQGAGAPRPRAYRSGLPLVARPSADLRGRRGLLGPGTAGLVRAHEWAPPARRRAGLPHPPAPGQPPSMNPRPHAGPVRRGGPPDQGAPAAHASAHLG